MNVSIKHMMQDTGQDTNLVKEAGHKCAGFCEPVVLEWEYVRWSRGFDSFLFWELEARVRDAGGALGAAEVFELVSFGVTDDFGLDSCLTGSRLV
ncbi:hypothetical protein HanPI659440_Chr16g0619491 [Helianthus annuus]|nr:hypothetical protein HanPI659440_Chr16g0619491 [Helianthus annuus]